MIHKGRIASRTCNQITQSFQNNFHKGSRGAHKPNEIYAQRLRFCILACFLAGYDRLRPTVNRIFYLFPRQVFSKHVTQITKMQCMAETKHLLPSCPLAALPSNAFYGAKFTIQQCNTLKLVVSYGQLILTTTLLLS